MNTAPLLASLRTFAGAFFLLASLGLAPAHAVTDEAALHDDLRKLKTVYENAINSGDLTPLEPLFAADSTGITVDSQSFKTYAELKSIYDNFRASLPGVVYRITLNPERSHLYGDIAVAYGTAEEYVKTADGEFTYQSSFTAVLRREGAQWKLVRSQMTMDPFKNSVVRHFISKTKLYFGGGALAAGLLLGLIVGRLSGSKKGAVT